MAMVGGLVRGGGGRGIAGRGVHTHCRLFGLLLFFWGGGGGEEVPFRVTRPQGQICFCSLCIVSETNPRTWAAVWEFALEWSPHRSAVYTTTRLHDLILSNFYTYASEYLDIDGMRA